MSNYYAAKELINQSISCVPIIKRSKAFDKWALDARGYKLADLRDTLPTVADIEYWWGSGGRNIAAISSEHLLILDFDKVSSYHVQKVKNPTLFHTRTTRTGNGFHVWYRISESIPKDVRSAIDGVECKHSGAAILVPGSVHPSGKQYQYVNCGLLNKLSILELVSVNVLVGAGLLTLGAAPPNPQQQPSKKRSCNVAAKDLASYLSAMGHVFTKSGDHYLKTTCPFHEDESPSFWVDVINQRGNCFVEKCRADKPMDLYDVIMRLHGVGFKQAKRMVAG